MMRFVQTLMAVPDVLAALTAMSAQLTELQKDIAALKAAKNGSADGWMDSAAARAYVANTCRNTWDTLRAGPNPPPGHPLGGRIMYKTSDLDRWIRLYEGS